MAIVDYAALKDVVRKLISSAGREVTFIKFNTTLSDSNRPWLGATDPNTDRTEVKLFATFVPISGLSKLGMSSGKENLFARSDQVCLVEPGTNNLKDFDEILDDGSTWKIEAFDQLKPGSVDMLNFIGVKR